MSPLVSIALCTFNGEKFIKEQLDSLLNQTYDNLEIIVIDDASTDLTASILKEYSTIYPQLQIHFNTKNIGFNENFKKAIRLCKGAYIAVSDQDDIWLPQKIQILVNQIGKNQLIYHDSEFIDEHGKSLKMKTSTHHLFAEGSCSESFLYFNCVSGHAILFQRDLAKMLDFLPQDMYYDWWLAYSAACTAKIKALDDVLVKHRKHSDSTTQKDTNNPRALRIRQLTYFRNHPLTPPLIQGLIVKLLKYYEDIEKNGFSFKLFNLLLWNSNLLFIRKMSKFSSFKWLIKECRKYG